MGYDGDVQGGKTNIGWMGLEWLEPSTCSPVHEPRIPSAELTENRVLLGGRLVDVDAGVHPTHYVAQAHSETEKHGKEEHPLVVR